MTTPSEKAAAPSSEVGFGYLHKSGTGYTFIIEGKSVVALPNTKAGDNEKAPNFNLMTFDEKGKSTKVGGAWVGETKQSRVKLSLKVGKVYYTAVKRDKKEGANPKQADFTVFK